VEVSVPDLEELRRRRLEEYRALRRWMYIALATGVFMAGWVISQAFNNGG
jgi:hypothetical protein